MAGFNQTIKCEPEIKSEPFDDRMEDYDNESLVECSDSNEIVIYYFGSSYSYII